METFVVSACRRNVGLWPMLTAARYQRVLHAGSRRVHAAAREDGAGLHLDVGRRHAQGAAALYAGDDAAGRRRGPAEDLAHLLQLPVVQRACGCGSS